MFPRRFWLQRIEAAWRQAPVVWLAGVRRSGKTTLASALGEDRALTVNCDLPPSADRVADPEFFYRNVDRPVVVFDEIHQLRDPSRLLKIGADLFPKLRILATGSSTLAASRKFRDTLTGRKRLVRLTPVLWDELPAFGRAPILKRLLHGGLPEALLAEAKPMEYYREWLDSFYARDIARLFSVRSPDRFHALLEYALRQSGGLFDSSKASRDLGVSRPTVTSYLAALASTHVISIVRPFHGGGRKEMVKMPRVYGFDTGFVAFCRGWDPLRPDDCGTLWEHVVLEYLEAHRHLDPIHYWRDAADREIDFVVPAGRRAVDAIECKWDPAAFDPSALRVFRRYYPDGRNYLIAPLSGPAYSKRFGDLEVLVGPPGAL